MILIFDTETTGMVRWHESSTDSKQPRVVQLGAALYHPDGTELSAVSLLVDSGATIEPEAVAVHGIDAELLRLAGISPFFAARLIERLAEKATLLVCHNVAFDRKMAKIEFHNTGVHDARFMTLPTFCTMQATTPICRLPARNGGYKWPKLTEAYHHFFNEPLIGAHAALSDVRACARLYFHLQRQDAVSAAP